MSTVVIFGYIGAPQGKPGACPIQYVQLDPGEVWDNSDINALVVDSSGGYAQGPLVGTVGYFTASNGNPMVVTLGRTYWPVRPNLPGYHRDCTAPPYFWSLGTSIRVSSAEAAALKHAGALATW
jgi:hypothetical protein